MSSCLWSGPPWSGGYLGWRPLRTPQQAFIIPVAVNGQAFFAKVDTGAQVTSITRLAALAAGATVPGLDAQPRLSATVANRPDVTLHRWQTDTLMVGSARVHNAILYVNDTWFDDVDVLIGMDLLHTCRVWLSYRAGLLYMQYAGQS